MSGSPAARWPDVPACYEWLSLDRRGDWRLQGERVTHRGLIDFLNRHYGIDEAGRGVVHNGPQKVYVDLAATPWVLRRDGDGLLLHNGAPAGAAHAALLDADGNLYLACAAGFGLLDDRDLAALLGECRRADGSPVGDEDFLRFLADGSGALFWRELPLQRVIADQLPARFGYVTRPRP